MLTQLFSNPLSALIAIVCFIIAVTIHEFAHAKAADSLGDPTPEAYGRLTLDPRAHLDPWGSLLFLLVGFGWAKPVPFDPYNFSHPRRDGALVAAAGPMTNIACAILAALIIRLVPFGMFSAFLGLLIYVNVMLAIFNLLPFAPLDGFKVVLGLLSKDQASEWIKLERYGIWFLLFFMLPLTGSKSMLELYIVPLIQKTVGILIGG
ncbi:MAG: Peptidase family M50 [Microgenomates bacterium OLB22]|nr:MAG: Peptidase family M50 [Microgenomates bacterium OLB22]